MSDSSGFTIYWTSLRHTHMASTARVFLECEGAQATNRKTIYKVLPDSLKSHWWVRMSPQPSVFHLAACEQSPKPIYALTQLSTSPPPITTILPRHPVWHVGNWPGDDGDSAAMEEESERGITGKISLTEKRASGACWKWRRYQGEEAVFAW